MKPYLFRSVLGLALAATGHHLGAQTSDVYSSLRSLTEESPGDRAPPVTDLAVASGTVAVSGQKLIFSGASSGVTVFNFDADLLNGDDYDHQFFSGISIDVPAHAEYIIDISNSDGKTIFGRGIDFNALTGDSPGRLRCIVVPEQGAVIPEPAAAGSVLGLLALAWAVRNRRRPVYTAS
jgi:hypothetical protein